MPTSLTEIELAEVRRALPCWTIDMNRGALSRSFHTHRVLKGVGLIVEVTLQSYERNSRPEWLVRHDRVDVWLITEGSGGVSSDDVALALQIDIVEQQTPSLAWNR